MTPTNTEALASTGSPMSDTLPPLPEGFVPVPVHELEALVKLTNFNTSSLAAHIASQAQRWLRSRAEPQAAQPEHCRTDGRCQYAIDHGAEGLGHCPPGKCVQPEQAQQSELASILARLEAVPLPGPTHVWLRGLRTQQELEDLRAAMLAAAKGVME